MSVPLVLSVTAVFDAYMFNDRLPGSIEAFFYLDDMECNERKCKGPARQAHASFLKQFPGAQAVPLLELNLGNAERLFSDAPPAPPGTIGAPAASNVLSEADIRCMRCPLCCDR